MSRMLNVAAIQMDVAPAPTAERLARAECLVEAAAQAGAQLVVLPEVFNTGYAYTTAETFAESESLVDDNHRRAEPLDGPTVTWMKASAARLGVHIVGTLMLLENAAGTTKPEIYNAMLMVAPDGQVWRYDKTYPWGWERGYFRGADRSPSAASTTVVAETDLGDFGMLICWDVAHPDLWQRYAGRVDMMVICSSPPDFSNAVFHFPDGGRMRLADMGPVVGSLKDSGHRVFGETIDQQTAWLQVPAVNTVGSGTFKSPVPNGRLALLAFLPIAPHLARYIPMADQISVTCDMLEGTRIMNAQGHPMASLSQPQGEAYTMARVELVDEKQRPQGTQPPPPVPWLSFFVADVLLPLVSLPIYRKGVRRAWGEAPPPPGAKMRRWLPWVGAIMALIVGVGVWRRNRRGRRK